MKVKPIVVIAGEPQSIFFEIFFKALKKKIENPIILICCKKLLVRQMKFFKFKKSLNFIDNKKILEYQFCKKKIYVIDIPLKSFKKNNTNEYIRKCFQNGFSLIKNKISKKLINGPINKTKFLNKKYIGITEYISKNFETDQCGMLIYNKRLSVCPATTHLPINLVAKKINQNLIIKKLKIIHNFYVKTLKKKPKIAVTGLNPHCESILKFDEDKKIITPAIKSSKKNGISVSGPYPADTIFLKQNREKFDVILGMYHDQVLTPLKTLFEYDAINITMGLPFLRVSPDHGPNEKMVGKNLSNPTSLSRALEFLDKN